MGTFTFSMMMLKKEYKKSIFYCVTMLFATAMSFIFFHIINNEFLRSYGVVSGGATWQDVQVPFSTVLSFLIIIFCCFMIFFANNFYISRKTKEIALLALSGSSALRSTMYLVYQTTTLMLIAAPLGIGLGMLLAPYVNQFMYQYLHVTSSIYYIPSSAIIQTLVLLAMLEIMLCVFAGGYIYRNDIKYLLAGEQEMLFQDKRKLKLPLTTYIVIYLFGFVMMIMAEHGPSAYVAPSFIGIMGAVGIIKYVLPAIITKCKANYLLTKRYALVYISNLNYSIRRAVILVVLLTASVTGMIAVLASQQSAPREYVTALMGYVVIVILLITSILYKFCMETQNRKTLYYNMWKIGYTKEELKKMIRSEVQWFYFVLLCIPLPYVIAISGAFVYHKEMTLLFSIVLALVYIIPIIICACITYFVYKKAVLSPIGGN